MSYRAKYRIFVMLLPVYVKGALHGPTMTWVNWKTKRGPQLTADPRNSDMVIMDLKGFSITAEDRVSGNLLSLNPLEAIERDPKCRRPSISTCPTNRNNRRLAGCPDLRTCGREMLRLYDNKAALLRSQSLQKARSTQSPDIN